jgi:hypothetical protein
MKKELIPEPRPLVATTISAKPNQKGQLRNRFSTNLLTDLFYVPRRFLETMLIQVLTTEEKARLSRYLFNVFPKAPGEAVPVWGETLAPWEETWFRRRLPAPPARVLLGGCGAGREVVALMKEGFYVDAFDPAPNLVSSTRAAVGDKARILTFGYEELSAAVLDDTSGPASSLEKYYDAVLLGWGSLTCLMDPTERMRLIRALDLICPKGPILASFWCTNGYSPRKPTRRRTERLGRALGVAMAKLRGVRPETASQEHFMAHSGFGHVFAPEEIEQLGATIGRSVIWDCDDTDYSHVTFVAQ